MREIERSARGCLAVTIGTILHGVGILCFAMAMWSHNTGDPVLSEHQVNTVAVQLWCVATTVEGIPRVACRPLRRSARYVDALVSRAPTCLKGG